MEQRITSTKNLTVQWMRSLLTAKGRRENGAILVEGCVMIREAVECGLAALCVFYSDPLVLEAAGPLPGPVRIVQTSPDVLRHICDTVTPQGIAAAFTVPAPTAAQDLRGAIVVLDSVQDPGNCGTIARTADAAGFGGIVFGAGSADPLSPKVMRASMGSMFRLPYAQGDLADLYPLIRRNGYAVFASSLDGKSVYEAVPSSEKTALVIGNEASGISVCTRANADMLLKIPMRGGAESLNASVAAGILMYEMTRPREKAGM